MLFNLIGQPMLNLAAIRNQSLPYILSSIGMITLLFYLDVRAADVQVLVVSESQQPLVNAVIVIEPLGQPLNNTFNATAQVAQIDRAFVPHVQVVQTHTSVSFPNHDDVRHHVYSFSEAKRFELPLYQGTEAAPVVFDQAGIVTLACNIHDQMLGFVYVTDSPWFAVTNASGQAMLRVPDASDYRLRVWHPSLGANESGVEAQYTADQLHALVVTLEPPLLDSRRLIRRTLPSHPH
ncbi:methylamine utilization protein [Nitrincola tibetensis]|uniref:methylamine utilization protein n=1 Tax=Nitrincola tibetensis TaxID=2219697 RepID=UPI00105814FF|nr:methylamine utilization protein [Nitrincola tibetensis]